MARARDLEAKLEAARAEMEGGGEAATRLEGEVASLQELLELSRAETVKVCLGISGLRAPRLEFSGLRTPPTVFVPSRPALPCDEGVVICYEGVMRC